jgi:hypothetical protein
MADIFYTDAPTIDGDPYPWEMPQNARPRRRLRQWHKALLATAVALLLPAGLYLAGLASSGLALIVAGVMLLELLIWLLAAWKWRRL